MKKQPINLSASVRQRLLNRARTEHRPFIKKSQKTPRHDLDLAAKRRDSLLKGE